MPIKLRRHLRHFERLGGTGHFTWRLDSRQTPLNPSERGIVFDVLRRDIGTRCDYLAAVVMDDHVHVLSRPIPNMTSARLLHAWKSVSAHELCRLSRTAPIWQAEYYLRWMNSALEIEICATYIRNNPSRRWPGIGAYPWLL